MAALQTKIDAPDVIIVSKFASPTLAHDASVLQHIRTFCDGVHFADTKRGCRDEAERQPQFN
jgi:hypothetical protein